MLESQTQNSRLTDLDIWGRHIYIYESGASLFLAVSSEVGVASLTKPSVCGSPLTCQGDRDKVKSGSLTCEEITHHTAYSV